MFSDKTISEDAKKVLIYEFKRTLDKIERVEFSKPANEIILWFRPAVNLKYIMDELKLALISGDAEVCLGEIFRLSHQDDPRNMTIRISIPKEHRLERFQQLKIYQVVFHGGKMHPIQESYDIS